MNYLPPLPTVAAVEETLRRPVESLPVLPTTAARLLKIGPDGDASIRDLARVVETDPAISAKVLQLVNSAAFAQPEPVGSLGKAVVILGFSRVRTLALGVALHENLGGTKGVGGASGLDLPHFWQHSLAVASLARSLAEEIGYDDPDAAYAAGLLHDIGKLVLAFESALPYGAFLERMEGLGQALPDSEREWIGMGHDELGGFLAARWGLPEVLVTALRFHHHHLDELPLAPEQATLVAIVALADFLAWNHGMGSIARPLAPLLPTWVDRRLDPERLALRALVARMDGEVREVGAFYGFTFPGAEILRENLIRANLHMARLSGGMAAGFDPPTIPDALETLPAPPASDPEQAPHSQPPLESLLAPHRSLNPGKVVHMTLEAIWRDFGFVDICFFRMDRPRRVLVGVHCLHQGRETGDLVDREISITSRSQALLTCLRTRRPAMLKSEENEDKALLQTLGVVALGLVPVPSGSQVRGVIAIPFADEPDAWTQQELDALSPVAAELGRAMRKARAVAGMRYRAKLDGLTGLFNRTAIDGLYRKAVVEAQYSGAPLAVAMVDIDHFKRFNDTHGHAAGDTVLKIVARFLIKVSRATTLVGRYGGEEFLVVMPGVGAIQGKSLCDRMRMVVERAGVLLEKRFPGTSLTISIGCAVKETGASASEELIRQADVALYEAKNQGRNRVVVKN